MSLPRYLPNLSGKECIYLASRGCRSDLEQTVCVGTSLDKLWLKSTASNVSTEFATKPLCINCGWCYPVLSNVNSLKKSLITIPQYCFTSRVVQIRALSVYLSPGRERTRSQTGAEFNKQQGLWEEEAFQDTYPDQVEGMVIRIGMPL
jgi:hypothetical protein